MSAQQSGKKTIGRNVTLMGLNVPARIGRAICLPGDIVHGTKSGITFVPAHLAQETVEYSERLRMREAFGFAMVRKGVYNSSQVDSEWTKEMEGEYAEWRKKLSPAEEKKILVDLDY